MASQETQTNLKRVAKGKKPQYFADPATDKLLSMVLTLTQELCVATDRINTLESLLDQKGLLERSEIEHYKPADQETKKRDAARALLIKRIFRSSEAEYQNMSRDHKLNPEDSLT